MHCFPTFDGRWPRTAFLFFFVKPSLAPGVLFSSVKGRRPSTARAKTKGKTQSFLLRRSFLGLASSAFGPKRGCVWWRTNQVLNVGESMPPSPHTPLTRMSVACALEAIHRGPPKAHRCDGSLRGSREAGRRELSHPVGVAPGMLGICLLGRTYCCDFFSGVFLGSERRVRVPLCLLL